jgi:UPF0755 protein
MGRKFLWALAALAVIIFIFVFVELRPVNSASAQSADIEILSGSSRGQIAGQLAAAHVVKSALLTQLLLVFNNTQVRPGIYQFTPNQSTLSIVQTLKLGQLKTVRVTIIEGWRAQDIENYLVKEKGLSQMGGFAALAQADEGYLFPDTYELLATVQPSELIALMRSNFTKRTQGLTVTSRAVILASIVEREARDDADRPLIASVYWNRLARGMRLEADPTIQYALGSWAPITTADYRSVISPYNTYLNDGLPPGPIANPGLKSLEAVLNPAQTDYLYFFHANNQTYFATTLAEHEAQIAKYSK